MTRSDSALAEQFTITLIDRFRDSPIRPDALWDLVRFVWVPERSTRLKEHFSQAMIVKLRRDIRPDTPTWQLDSALSAAQSMTRRTAASFPHLQPEFDSLAYELAALLNARPDRPSASAGRIVISMGDKTEPGDTQEISDVLPKADRIKDQQAKDKEYQKLAVKAALKENLWLAEDIISKITTKEIRQGTTFKVYDPFIKKAISESNWSLSEKYALKVEDPLGRTLMFERMAQAMARSDKDKPFVKRIYDVALTRLERESPTEMVAKAFLIVARSLYPLDPMDGTRAINSAVSVLNELTKSGDLPEEPSLRSELHLWVRLPNSFAFAEEAIDTIDMFGAVLRELAKRDTKEALIIATGFTHPGLEALAHLAVSKALLEEAKKPSSRTTQEKRPVKKKSN